MVGLSAVDLIIIIIVVVAIHHFVFLSDARY